MTDALEAPDYEDMFDIEEDAARAGADVIDDPFPKWAELLEQGPVHRGPIAKVMGLEPNRSNLYAPGFEYFTVFNFAGVSEGFTRKDDFDSGFYRDTGTFTDAILGMDGLRHRRFRDVIQEYFQPAYAGSWWREKVIKGLVDELVSAFENDETADLNSQLFARLPLRTVTEAFGLSQAEGLAFRKNVLASMDHAAAPDAKASAFEAAEAILRMVIVQRQSEPRDDIISRLVEARLKEEDGSARPLTVDEIAGYCRLIVFAGGGTTWKQLGITTYALLNNPEQMEAVRTDRSLLPKAILESARWYPNDPVFPRKAKRDTELQGMKIPEGAVLHLCLGSANRDPARWKYPDKFDINRQVQRSVAFAAGPHSCLGQHVAREEILAALNALLDRFPDMHWDTSKPPAKLSGGLISRGPGPLPVQLR